MSTKGVFRYPRILVGGFLALATLNVMNSAYSSVLDTIKTELALSYTQSGALMSAYFIGYTLGQIPWGILSDKKGSRLTMSLSVFSVSLASILFGLSPSFTWAIITRFLSGLLGAGVFVPGVRLVSGWFEANERGTALGILSIGGSLGLVFASWYVPVVSLRMGWRLTVEIAGVFGTGLAVLIWILIRDKDTGAQVNPNTPPLPLGDKRFWWLALSQFVRFGTYNTFIAWIPLLLIEDYGFSTVMMSSAFSLFNLAGIVSNPLGGYVSDRIGEGKTLLISYMSLALLMAVLLGRFQDGAIYVIVFMIGWFINFVRSPSFSIIPRLFGSETSGSVSGIHNTFASFGAFVLPMTLGLVKDTTNSYSPGWMAFIGLYVAASILILMIIKQKTT